MDYSIPLNIPAKSLYKFIYVYENEYDKLLNPIFNSGNYCTYAQFTEIYKQMYPNISDSYAIKKCRSILKKLDELKFIEICSINKHKYFYLKSKLLNK